MHCWRIIIAVICGKAIFGCALALRARKVDTGPLLGQELRPGRTHGAGGQAHDPRLGRHRYGLRLPVGAFRRCQLWRPAAQAGRGDIQPSQHLCLVAGGLLHVVDLLRLGRPRLASAGSTSWPSISGRSCCHRLRLPADAAHRAPRQGAEHHLHRRLRRRALRQERAGRGARHHHRGHRRRALHRAAAEGDRRRRSRRCARTTTPGDDRASSRASATSSLLDRA